MEYDFFPLTASDREAVMDIFNHYVENSFAAYPEKKLPYEAFDNFLKMCEGYPSAVLKDKAGNTLGFSMLRPHNPMSAFSETSEITLFLHPCHTGRGLGKAMLDHLEKRARQQGISNIMANISSLNPGSIKFHRKNGFSECGRFRGVGKKSGKKFDTVWMQKIL